MKRKKTEPARWILIGTGSRGLHMFGEPLAEGRYPLHRLVGLCDCNPLRAEAANKLLKTRLPTEVEAKRLIARLRPDGAIIATRDIAHAEYIRVCLVAGLRVVSEKPLCVDARQCRDILATEKKYKSRGGRCLVTHNVRYAPAICALKNKLDSGVIGKPLFFRFREYLDRRHGADYFRRWHRHKENSGGLLIHKACHHFDALNYLTDSVAETLSARGRLLFYGRKGSFRGKRCRGCRHATRCAFYVDPFGQSSAKRLFLDAEQADGYWRDACVFDKEINIEDEASVSWRYRNGVSVQYDLAAFCSYEGWRIEVEGERGRLELVEMKSTGFVPGAKLVHGAGSVVGERLTLFRMDKPGQNLPIPKAKGTHGGADPRLLADFFGRPLHAPLTSRQAPLVQAVQAVLIGHAANVSLARKGAPVNVQDFLKRG
jgi:predicted dehydrogenase